MKHDPCIRAATRIAVALEGSVDPTKMFPKYSDFEDCMDLVIALLEAATDELKPLLEERARIQEHQG